MTGNTQHWQPRMPVWISSPSFSWNDEVTRSRRLPQYGHRRMSNVLMCIRSLLTYHGFAKLFEHRVPAGFKRRSAELLDAQETARLLRP